MKPKLFLFTQTACYGSVFGIIDTYLFIYLFIYLFLSGHTVAEGECSLSITDIAMSFLGGEMERPGWFTST